MIELPLSKGNLQRLPGCSWINIVYNSLLGSGYQPILSGKISLKDDVEGSLMISDMYTSYTGKLLSRGAIPFLIFSLESPNISKFFYKTYQNKYRYKNAYLFPGAFDFFGGLTNNINLFWPNSPIAKCYNAIEKDIFVGMIASNKQTYNRRFWFVPRQAEQLMKSLYWRSYYKKLKKNDYVDLYETRLNAIDYFINHDDFSLYGRGWKQRNTLKKQLYKKILNKEIDEIDDKFETLSRMKFSICFENFKFPGYITEKIFDCFLTGSIPIYLGAPDIADYVPSEAFIDARRFSSFEEVDYYIHSLSEEQIATLRNAGEKFLNSPDYYKFTDEAFASNIMKLITTANF